MKTNIAIIGGGVSGITSALTLQLLGYDTEVHASSLVTKGTPRDPRFASLYPAASIIPHSLATSRLQALFAPSQEIFELLLELHVPGMQRQRHYEIYEFPVDDPPYSASLQNFSRIGEIPANNRPAGVPSRPGAELLHGWAFDCLLASWPTYMEQLYRWYEKAGGTVINQRLDPSDIERLDSETVVNCAGIWSPELFEDSQPRRVLKGHLLHLPQPSLLRDAAGRIPSYNYTPLPEIYPDPGGGAADVYFYPRSNGWILGGSRLKGVVDAEGNWEGDEPLQTQVVDGLEVPRQILGLNGEILRHSYGVDLDQYSEIHSKVGYRYVRSFSGDGLRLDVSEEYGRRIVHNYGHGGAGITLSWGCALDVAALVAEGLGKETASFREQSIAKVKKGLESLLS